MSEFNWVLDEEGIEKCLLFDLRRRSMWKHEVAIKALGELLKLLI
jgi:hypothetical protein